MNGPTLILIAILSYIAIQIVIGFRQGDNPTICSSCGTRGKTKTVTKGSIALELILWLCFIVPGIIYSIWRLTTRHEACAKCGASTLIPLDTPAGQELAKRYTEIASQ